MYAPRARIFEEGKHLKTFIETGTYLGETAQWASEYWDVHTIEVSPKLFRKDWGARITSYFGDSRDILKNDLYDRIKREACLFWLDGHWFDHGLDVGGTEFDCPLIEELRIITSTEPDHVIFIDDAHLIKEKHERYAVWPSVEGILEASGGYFMETVENTILLRRGL
jgi:uncharacterized protein YbdZ (MbtH family)